MGGFVMCVGHPKQSDAYGAMGEELFIAAVSE